MPPKNVRIVHKIVKHAQEQQQTNAKHVFQVKASFQRIPALIVIHQMESLSKLIQIRVKVVMNHVKNAMVLAIVNARHVNKISIKD